MIERIIESVPDDWRPVAELVTAPLAWIPDVQRGLMAFFADSPTTGTAVAKYVFLACPALLALVAIWCTQLALYTLPFRAGRTRFVSLILLSWWDAGRAVWMFWVSLARFAAVFASWLLALVHLAVRLVGAAATTAASVPAAFRRRLTLPSLAVVMLAFWCVLEAAVFAHTVRPAMAKVLADIAGIDETSRLIGPGIFAALLVLVLGSFVCLQALADAARRFDLALAARLLVIQLFVMAFEVMFLYRQLALKMVPETAESPSVQGRLLTTVALGAVAWLAVRSVTWLLFARHGVAPVLAFVTTPAAAGLESAERRLHGPAAWWRPSVDEFERDIDWLHAKGDQLLEYLAVPALQLLAAALNFAMILVAARPVFNLPFAGLRDVTGQRDLEATDLAPRKLSL
jgi:hypothetical protein